MYTGCTKRVGWNEYVPLFFFTRLAREKTEGMKKRAQIG
jgi:hypothetical protein